MAGNAGTNWLMRLIALLLSLADAGEAAAGRSRRVRRKTLAILRQAETSAYAAITDAARHFGAPIPAIANFAYSDSLLDDGDDPDDLLRVAARLRALTVALTNILAWADYFARRFGAPRHTPWRDWQVSPAALARGYDVPAFPAPDTS